MRLRLGTRGSALALAQSRMIATAIEHRARSLGTDLHIELVKITTQGDVDRSPLAKLGGTGVFVARLREALLTGECDIAVHSCKDLPSGEVPGLTLAALPAREDPRDVLCSRTGAHLADLDAGAKVGTGSPRRSAAIRALRPDLEVVDIRGNVPTRLSRLQSDLDAVVLAAAGLTRLGLKDAISEYFAPEAIIPAAAQGALAVETRSEDTALIDLVSGLDDMPTRLEVSAERSLMNALDAGCAAPLGVLGRVVGTDLHLEAGVWSPNGRRQLRLCAQDSTDSATQGARLLGERLAHMLLEAGASQIADLQATKAPTPHTHHHAPKNLPSTDSARASSDTSRTETPLAAHSLARRPRVLITRDSSPQTPDPFVHAIEALGIECVSASLTRTEVDAHERQAALDELAHLENAWVLFTSKRALDVLAGDTPDELVRLLGSARQRGVRFGAVGQASARHLSHFGVTAQLIGQGNGASLVHALDQLRREDTTARLGKTILLPRSASGDPTLATQLRASGWTLSEKKIYDTLALPHLPSDDVRESWSDPALLAAVITAPSSLRALINLCGPARPTTPLITLGASSSAHCAQLAPASPVLTASAPTPEAVTQVLSSLLDTGGQSELAEESS